MRKITLLCMCCLCSMAMLAGEITEEQALQKAQQVLKGKQLERQQVARTRGESKAAPAYYVFNAEANGGFAVIAANDQMPEVLGYAEQGHLDPSKAPDNVKWLLDYYASIAKSLKNAPARGDRAARTRGINNDARPELVPLMSTQWNQDGIYQQQCPEINGNKTLTGCVATAMAQVVNFFQWPLNSVREAVGYTSNKNEAKKPKIDLPPLPARKFNWFNMSDDDIASLMRYCGQSVMMNYNLDESLANTTNIPGALISVFNFSKGVDRVEREEFTDEEWEEALYKEIELGRPVIYSGYQGMTGHTFVLHGYKNGQFYINWGWGGDFDGYFALTSLTPSNLDFSEKQEAVVGIQPASNNDISYDEKTEIGFREVVVQTPGQLATLLPESERYRISRLKVSGDINGDDIEVMIDMSKNKNGGDNQGRLSKLDLSDAHILGETAFRDYTTDENEISAYMFFQCITLKEVILPKTLTRIGAGAFGGTSLTSIVIPKDVNDLIGSVLALPGMESIIVDEQNPTYYSQNNAIYERKTGKLIRGCKASGIPEGVEVIGDGAFEDAGLESIILPKSIKVIENNAFINNSNVNYLYIPANVKEINDKAFLGCNFLSITVDPENTVYDSRNACNAIIETKTNTLIQASEGTLTIPATVTTIMSHAFARLTMKKIEIPQNVVNWDENALSEIRATTIKVSYPEPIVFTNEYSPFGMIEQNARLIVPDGTRELYANANYWNMFTEGDRKIIEESDYSQNRCLTVNVAEAGTLESLIGDKNGVTEELKVTGQINGKDIKFLKDLCGQYGMVSFLDLSDASIVAGEGTTANELPEKAFQTTSTLKNIVLPKNLTAIGSFAFDGSGIKELVLPKSVETLGSDIFYYAGDLESLRVESGNTVFDSRDNCNAIIETSTNTLLIGCKKTVIPESVSALGNMAFSGKPGLKEVSLPNNITSIGWAAFWADSELTTVTLSANVTSLGDSPFGACERITSFSVDKGNTKYDSRENCNAIIETASNTLIQGFSTTKIPDGVKAIAPAAFRSLATLTEIELPASLEKIESEAFLYCNQLTKVVSNIRKPFAISSMVFSGDNMKIAKLYVPYGTREAYANTPGWDNFRTIIEMDPVEGEYTKNGASVVTTDFGKGYAALNGKVSVPIILTGEGMEPVTSIDYFITTNGTTTQHQLELSEPVTFMMQREVLVPIDADATVGERDKLFKLTKVNGAANECTTGNMQATGKLVTIAKKPKVVPVVEEATGTWCGWCARGIPGLALLNKVYGDDVITLAVHGGGNGDPMILNDYQLDAYRYPSCRINRGETVDPYYGSGSEAFGISREVEAAQRSYVPAGIEVTADWTDATLTKISVKTTTIFVEDVTDANYRIGYVLAEDGLKGNTPEWYQSNYYAGSALKDENLVNLTGGESKITNVVYNYIPVAAYEPFDGIDGSVPATITKDVAMEHKYTIDISGNTRIQDKTKLSVVALLIDKTNGKIVNAAKFMFNQDSDNQTGFQFLPKLEGELTPPVGKTGLAYTGAAQDLITEGSSTTGTVQYSLDGTNYSTTIPQGTDAKEYTVYYKVVAKDGYKDVEPASLKVTIAPKTVSSPTITLSQTSYNYDSTAKQPTVTVKDGTTDIPASEYTVSYKNNTAVGAATVTITDNTGGNYTVSGSTTFTIVLKGDTNGDGKVNVADIVKAIKDGKPQADIDDIVKIIFGK